MISYYCKNCGKLVVTTTTNTNPYEIDLYPYDCNQVEIYRYWDRFNPDRMETVCSDCLKNYKDIGPEKWAFGLWFKDNLYTPVEIEEEKLSGLLKAVK